MQWLWKLSQGSIRRRVMLPPAINTILGISCRWYPLGTDTVFLIPTGCHAMKNLSVLLALCAGIPLVSQHKGPVMQSFGYFLDMEAVTWQYKMSDASCCHQYSSWYYMQMLSHSNQCCHTHHMMMTCLEKTLLITGGRVTPLPAIKTVLSIACIWYPMRKHIVILIPWGFHATKNLSTSLALCAGNPLVISGFPALWTSNAEFWRSHFLAWIGF